MGQIVLNLIKRSMLIIHVRIVFRINAKTSKTIDEDLIRNANFIRGRSQKIMLSCFKHSRGCIALGGIFLQFYSFITVA